MNALAPRRRQTRITSLIEEFRYPRLGPGMMWERVHELVEAQGSKVLFGTRLEVIRRSGGQRCHRPDALGRARGDGEHTRRLGRRH